MNLYSTCTNSENFPKGGPRYKEGWGRGSALDICSLIHELNIQQIIIIEYSEGPPK